MNKDFVKKKINKIFGKKKSSKHKFVLQGEFLSKMIFAQKQFKKGINCA